MFYTFFCSTNKKKFICSKFAPWVQLRSCKPRKRPTECSLPSKFNTSKNNNCSLMKIQKSSDIGATDVAGETACEPVLEVASDENILDDYCKNKESGCDVKSSNATQDSVCVNHKTLARLKLTMHYLHCKTVMLNSKFCDAFINNKFFYSVLNWISRLNWIFAVKKTSTRAQYLLLERTQKHKKINRLSFAY